MVHILFMWSSISFDPLTLPFFSPIGVNGAADLATRLTSFGEIFLLK